jgi:hypothetical protein
MRRGQSTLEYIYILGIFIVAIIAMGIYMKRGFEGKYHELGGQMGAQYSPDATTTVSNITQNSTLSSNLTTNINKVYATTSTGVTGVTILAQNQASSSNSYSTMSSNIQDNTTNTLAIGGD